MKQQMFMWASTAGGTDGGEVITCPFSDYLENNQMCFSQYNKHSIEFTVNTYAGAFTDVANYLYAPLLLQALLVLGHHLLPQDPVLLNSRFMMLNSD